ncbi:MAG: phage tail assembly chaperone [Sneathiellaceae bacterium]
MFVLDENPQFEAPLDIQLPGGRKQRIRGTFNVLPVDRVEELLTAIGKGGEDAKAAMADLIDEAWVDWKDVVGPDKQPVEFSPERLHALMQLPYVRAAFLDQYPAELGGRGRRKN